jgi:hypothetical protein
VVCTALAEVTPYWLDTLRATVTGQAQVKQETVPGMAHISQNDLLHVCQTSSLISLLPG